MNLLKFVESLDDRELGELKEIINDTIQQNNRILLSDFLIFIKPHCSIRLYNILAVLEKNGVYPYKEDDRIIYLDEIYERLFLNQRNAGIKSFKEFNDLLEKYKPCLLTTRQ